MSHPLLTLPGGLFVVVGLTSLITRFIDYGLAFLEIRIGEAFLGWPMLGPTYNLLDVSLGVYLIVLGVILSYLSRISARLRGLARSTGGSR